MKRPMKGKARLESQLRLYKIKAVPTIIYGSEMKSLCGLARYKHIDHPHNIQIRKKLKVFNLNIKIKNYRNWL
jgi:hypothetical protein